jgi:hypothetical protein
LSILQAAAAIAFQKAPWKKKLAEAVPHNWKAPWRKKLAEAVAHNWKAP